MTNIQGLLRPHLRNMTPYLSARRSMSGGTIWLNANESPYAPTNSDGSYYSINSDQLNRYPNFQSRTLNGAYANYAGVTANQVMSHRGSDEGIELLIRAFCEPGKDSVLICPPTYGMYAISAQLNNSATVSVPLVPTKGAYQLNLTAIEQALTAAKGPQVKVVFLCNPSNPLGNLLTPADIKAVLELARGKAMVVVDEAYIEYAEASNVSNTANTSTGLIKHYPHLVVLRTLSKAFGLAGIRVGFTLAQEAVINALAPVLAPYPLPAISIQIAEQALGPEGLINMRQNVIEAVDEREQLVIALAGFTWVTQLYPSTTNFILMQVENANALMSYCQQAGILLRQLSQPNLDQCIRISIGSPAENEQLVRVLRNFGATL
ncbi:histidinol-phosphate transaminase [Aliidiomarina quisquiliarum]|uniref:histidinol-phosphate transaminase n=1 Tax=Aliidiomarina quisquiliarum TaxID=2938947 RepID=UPI00208EA271|nr:histidinol-phosphate transaminase [Aliidiomarina quisquiliarum]MCO4320191.1 histidinol-phosphate transaminase [Aliidiomarina quisquiliarum]